MLAEPTLTGPGDVAVPTRSLIFSLGTPLLRTGLFAALGLAALLLDPALGLALDLAAFLRDFAFLAVFFAMYLICSPTLIFSMDPTRIIRKYFRPGTRGYRIYMEHAGLVRDKALKVAERLRKRGLKPDMKFIGEAAMLHDIGVSLVNAPGLGCHGDRPYICHGYLGREILEREGLPKHGLVAERHIGVGITREEIIRKKLPLPKRDMVPLSLEEKIIAFADRFFSKSAPGKENSVEKIKRQLLRHGREKARIFEEWVEFFGKG
jgi:uncharacterized protein